MANTYRQLKIADARKELHERFYRKNLDREERGIKFNVSKKKMIEFLLDTDRNPPKSNKQVQLEQQQRAERNRLNYILQLREQLESNPVHAFNTLYRLGHQFTQEDINRMFRTGGSKFALVVTVKIRNSTKIVNKYNLTLTRENIERFKSIILEGDFGENAGYAPDVDDDTYISNLQLLAVHQPQKKIMTDVRRGGSAHFKYLNTTDISLEKYQIYTADTQDESEDECCVIFALRKSGVEEKYLNDIMIKSFGLSSQIPLSKMNEIAQSIRRRITMKFYDENKERYDQYIYGKEFTEEVTLAHFKNHIFQYEPTEFTAFYIKNKDEIDNLECENKHELTEKNGKYWRSKNPKFLSSLELVVLLMKLNKFSTYGVSLNPSNNYEVQPCLDNLEVNQREYQGKKEKKETKTMYMFADCESDVSCDNHEMIAFGFSYNNKYYEVVRQKDETLEMYGERISAKIAKVAYENGYHKQTKIVMFFHNVKYDASLFQNMLYSNNEVSKDNQIYSKSFIIKYNMKIEFRDSYKHFGGKLSDATDTFKLGISKKEAIAYLYHNKNNMNHNLVSVEEYKTYLKEEMHVIFTENVKENAELFLFNGSSFDATQYYLYYLKYDVLVLEQAMNKYRELIKQITGLDAFEYLTISSIGFSYASLHGCFDGLHETSGSTREFIQKSIKGGRVYVNTKYKCTEIDEKIEDFDGVSLYPSSMSRLCKEYGLPKGEIKKGLEQSYSYYESKDWYIVRVRINKINKTQQIPCISVKVNETIQYINDLDAPLEVYIDKITLQDYIEFHEIEYEIIEGIYWDEGFNKKLGELILHLHYERSKYKATNKPLADMIKLIMNSIYGKTGQRSSTTQTVFISNDKKENYIYDHFGVISSWEDTKFNTKITKRCYDTSYSLNFVASAILSMSKRIMNEVFSVQNENKIVTFYTDTDSIHMLQKDVLPLADKYFEKYGRELIGKNLGQFHTDFDMKGCKDVHSIKHIPIAPKVYLDVLQGTNEETGEVEYDTHCRLKGVNTAGFEHEIMKRKTAKSLSQIDATIDLYRSLISGEEVSFVLNPTEHNVSFEFSNHGVATRKTGEFIRKIKINKEK